MLRIVNPSLEASAQEILRRMYNYLSLKEGQVVYENSEDFESFVPVLADAISFPKCWYADEIEGLTRRAVIETKRKGLETLADFFSDLNDRSLTLQSAPLRQYVMWTKIQIKDGRGKSLKFKVGTASVVISSSPPSHFKLAPYFINGLGDVDPMLPAGGMVALVTDSFRSDFQAGTGLYEPLADFVGLINFAFHYRVRQIHFGRLRPKANALIAENQFLFKEGASINNDRLWFNPEFRIDFWERAGHSFHELEKDAKYIRRFLAAAKSRPSGLRVMSALRMMVDGWSSYDVNARLFRSWTAFEVLLSNSSEKADPYDKIVKRAVFIAKEPDIWAMRLRHAAKSRNKIVHENTSVLAAEKIAATLERYFAALVNWMMFSKYQFQSHQDLLDTLELSPDSTVLEKQIQVRKRARSILQA